MSWPEITVIKTDNIIVFQVVICPVQLNPVNENLPLKEANFPACLEYKTTTSDEKTAEDLR
ncbi:hypothetical protein, partial [Escherichia coli]|uniref:hypothetical protein n=1 Tax=Escherichia coli TaxID=562 RepID=UPI001A7E555A